MTIHLSRDRRVALASLALLGAAGCGSDGASTEPTIAPEQLELSASQIRALDSTGTVIVAANPADFTLRALVDSTLLVLSAGVQAKRLPVTTDLTTAPLYFVGVHRVMSRAGNSWATWNVVGFDDPAHLTRLVEANGYASNSSATAPASMSGTIGDGSGVANGLLLSVATGGAVTEWRAAAGKATFTSDAAGAACPGFTPTPRVTCALEVMHVTFTVSAPSAAGGGGGARSAALTTTADVPTMRLTYTP